MTKYWLTFRIDQRTIGRETANERRERLYDTIGVMSSKMWIEPTSFILFSSDDTIDDIAAACRISIASDYDIVLIRKLDKSTARAVGNIEEIEVLEDFMPYLSTV